MRYSLIITIASQSSTLFLTSMTIKSYLKEIETQSKKPLEEQLYDIKIAGAKLLQIIDNLIPLVDNVVDALVKESNNKEKEDSPDWTNNINPPIEETK